ncbi:hypothetical protein HPO96_05175 [Kribbella sandramycini]|uniref:DUF4345 domain-containing protein n=1 Tax=Kribbella sandramycini TaxID=60450 RepID=A0A7Y4NX91_9ACTN|nr:hypothetical protein [Kribbella sandramycini]MBB6567772.1 hypothetical protein [Kribbella sandramycini]NOL39632.1 hypothetical protein [Kribbella sandramycini]
MGRVLIALLAVQTAMVGVWASFLPVSFYEDGPLPFLNTGWTALLPPYNEHLMRDYGLMNLGFAVVLFYTLATMSSSMVRMSMAAYLVFAVPHTIFHLTHLEHLSTGGSIGLAITLGLTVLLPLIVLVLSSRRVPADR